MNNLDEFKVHDIQQLRLKKIGKNYNWLADKLNTNRTYISFALTGKHPELLSQIVRFLDEYTSLETQSQAQ